MSLIEACIKLIGLTETLQRWLAALEGLQQAKRLKLAAYAGEIAACLARAADACEQGRPADLAREVGRLSGYVEDVAEALRGQLDGRKIAGVRRRLDALSACSGAGARLATDDDLCHRLREAEGYMRAVADRLQV